MPASHSRLSRRAALALLSTAPLALAGAAEAQAKPPVFSRRGRAINGYDPVAYFTERKPVKGDARFTHEWNGATWLFASAANRDRFAADPEAFAPRYGGYCAYAVSQGYTAKTDPRAWTIYEGRLYLNFSLSVRETWKRDIPGNIRAADRNWPGVLN